MFLFIHKLPPNIAKVISNYYFNVNNIACYDDPMNTSNNIVEFSNKWATAYTVANTIKYMVLNHNKYNLNFICELYKYNYAENDIDADSMIFTITRMGEMTISKHRY